MVKIRTFYDELSVGRDADAAEIKRAFKELAKDYHPDHNPKEKQDWAHEQMSRLNFIVETLLGGATRQEYDDLIAKYEMGLDRPMRTARQEYALQREHARLSVEIINLGEKYSNCRLKIVLGGVVSGAAILGLLMASVVSVNSTLLLAFGRFLTLVGLMMAGMGVSDYMGRGKCRVRIDELELKRSDLKRRMHEVWSPY